MPSTVWGNHRETSAMGQFRFHFATKWSLDYQLPEGQCATGMLDFGFRHYDLLSASRVKVAKLLGVDRLLLYSAQAWFASTSDPDWKKRHEDARKAVGASMGSTGVGG